MHVIHLNTYQQLHQTGLVLHFGKMKKPSYLKSYITIPDSWVGTSARTKEYKVKGGKLNREKSHNHYSCEIAPYHGIRHLFLLKLTFSYNKIHGKYRIQYTKHCFIVKASVYFVTWGKPIIRVNSSSD